jgi:uncharacterized membrane protein
MEFYRSLPQNCDLKQHPLLILCVQRSMNYKLLFSGQSIKRDIASPSSASFSSANNNLITTSRIESIDFLRGIVMVIMALDHVRAYLHYDSFLFSPTDLQHTTPALFATRLITHLCAPAFILLAGTSAYFISQSKTLNETSFFLLSRGLWLIVLQLTVIRFAWNFDIALHYNSSNIISTIGFSMIILSMLIHLRLKLIFIFGLVMIIGHNALDKITFENPFLDVIWSFLHTRKSFIFNDNYSFLFVYPIVPWVGVMSLGYCLGSLYTTSISSSERKKRLYQLGISSLAAFLLLRLINVYGDPLPWSHHQHLSTTIMSFFNLEKYPPSMLFLCLTVGISLILLGFLEGRNLEFWKPITLFGKVALFYYVLHILLIHLMAVVAVLYQGYPFHIMIFIGSNNQASPLLKGKFGFSLPQIYALWIFIVIMLYPFCTWWKQFKSNNKSKWWVSYL